MRRFASLLPASVGALLLVTAAACDTGDGRTLDPPTAPAPVITEPTIAPGTAVTLPLEAVTTTVPAGFRLVTPWRDGAPIGARHTCDGADLLPAFSWSGVPDGTAELAMIVTDDDADGFAHWVVVGIDPSQVSILEPQLPAGARALPNSFGVAAWNGPCPPAGAPHSYRFTLHALNQQLEAADDILPTDAIALIEQLSLDAATVFGTYSR